MQMQPLIRRADDLFRDYMKRKWGAPGHIQCVTCKGYFRGDLIDLGHIIRRACYATRWHEKNVIPQCIHCNRNLSGSGADGYLDEETEGELRRLASDRRFRLSLDFVNSIIEQYGEA